MSADADPHYQKLYGRVTDVCSNRRGQPRERGPMVKHLLYNQRVLGSNPALKGFNPALGTLGILSENLFLGSTQAMRGKLGSQIRYLTKHNTRLSTKSCYPVARQLLRRYPEHKTPTTQNTTHDDTPPTTKNQHTRNNHNNRKNQDATPSTNKEKQNSLTYLSYAKVPVARIKTNQQWLPSSRFTSSLFCSCHFVDI